jgi:hypothetical protein
VNGHSNARGTGEKKADLPVGEKAWKRRRRRVCCQKILADNRQFSDSATNCAVTALNHPHEFEKSDHGMGERGSGERRQTNEQAREGESRNKEKEKEETDGRMGFDFDERNNIFSSGRIFVIERTMKELTPRLQKKEKERERDEKGRGRREQEGGRATGTLTAGIKKSLEEGRETCRAKKQRVEDEITKRQKQQGKKKRRKKEGLLLE